MSRTEVALFRIEKKGTYFRNKPCQGYWFRVEGRKSRQVRAGCKIKRDNNIAASANSLMCAPI